ncbi:uncharacterized protein LOC116252987 [Nymphaea colorata]|nr:uncharacterized protein LOC116252987 [Nymphaea colorata]
MKKRRSRKMAEREGGNDDDEEEEEEEQLLQREGAVSSSSPTGRVSNYSEGLDAEDSDLGCLEEEVREMGERILSYRRTVPEQLKVAIGSFLVTSRPDLTRFGGGADDVAMEGAESTEPERSSNEASLSTGDQETSEKLSLIKTRISRNISSIPIILTRLKTCIERIDKLEGYKLETHIAFKRRRRNEAS